MLSGWQRHDGGFSFQTLRRIVLLGAFGLLLLPFGNACSKMELSAEALRELSSGEGSRLPVNFVPPAGAPNDTHFNIQWTLSNQAQLGGVAGEDSRVMDAWQKGYTGKSVIVAVVDDGLELNHPDLANNIRPNGSYNYNNQTTNPGGPLALHGTCVAGIMAAESNNGIGTSGVAHQAQIVGWNFLESNVNVTEVDAMTRSGNIVGVYNNSWGPGPGGRGTFRPSPATWRGAVQTGLNTGRGGKGSIYVFAAGNGAINALGQLSDSSNMNGYANFYGVTTVCAVDHNGEASVYSEPGANLWVCAPSGSGIRDEPAVPSTDLVGNFGYNLNNSTNDLSDRSYTRLFSGTSAAAPLVSGVVALMLEARPDLSWRDVKWILARSARKNRPQENGWAVNGANFNISYDYGFGVVDAAAAVELAKTWTLVGPMKTVDAPATPQAVNTAVPDNGSLVQSNIVVTNSGISKIEYVDVTVNMTHPDWGNLRIQVGRSGNYTTLSTLALNHRCLNDNAQEIDCQVSGNTFRFGTARHLGEAADGTWTLRVVDADTPDNKAGTLTSWQMRFYGE